MAGRARLLLFVFLIAGAPAVWAGQAMPAQRTHTLEGDVKAAFLYNFTKFIDWPASAFHNESDVFRVCVLADADFVKKVARTLEGETARGRPLQLVTPEAGRVAECHVLFIGRTESWRTGRILPLTAGKPVLTVGETPKFLEQGGAVNFMVEDDRVRFDVDLATAQRAGLIVSSKLLRVARTVREPTR